MAPATAEAEVTAEAGAAARQTPEPSDAPPPATGGAEVPAGSEFNRGAGDDLPVLPRAEGDRAGTAPLSRPAAEGAGVLPPQAETTSPAAPDVTQSLAVPATGAATPEPAPEGLPAAVAPAPSVPAAPAVNAPAAEPEPERAPQSQTGADTAADDVITLPPAGFPQGDLDALGTAPQGTGGVTAAAPLPTPSEDPAALPRLPQIGDDSAPQQEAALAPPATTEPEVSAPETPAPRLPGQAVNGPLTERVRPATGAEAGTAPLPPIQAFAAEYDTTDSRPRMSIVLIDEGDPRVSISSLRSFPYPISFAIDASRPDAALAMQAYRAAGFEVLLRADLPEGATPADVENAVQTWSDEVPEAVAVMEEAPGLLQRGRESSEQLAEALSESGHGLLLYPEGLNTARNLAVREGVPAATLFRDFDAQDEDARVIRRFLDYAALKAGQEGGVVMVGRLRPDTVSALLVWGLADRASQVHLVPVSAVLTEQLPG